jgi:molybdenum cofactor cytidylyltransferase
MRFGSVPLLDAEGAILAHSVQLASVRLRKGLHLTADHLRQLADEGHAEITVARLDATDLHEDAAAAELAQAVAAQGVLLTDPFTGRVNLLAPSPGVALIDSDKINALNSIDPMITCATVPPYQQMGQGGMIATVKIIAYGVPATDLRRAAAVAQDAISFAPSVLRSATLIVTEVPGGPGLTGQDAIESRLNALGITLEATLTCAHTEDALSKRLSTCTSDLILILTDSATSDPHDVAPEGLRQAGGTVTRFGMPVDPGNLLFLGNLGQTPVIGLPGCARAPALNGADWVLARVACGLEVTDQDIASMGVGGLLKEIPTRPQPRARRLPASAQPAAAKPAPASS